MPKDKKRPTEKPSFAEMNLRASCTRIAPPTNQPDSRMLRMQYALECIANAAKLAPATDQTIAAILLSGCSDLARKALSE